MADEDPGPLWRVIDVRPDTQTVGNRFIDGYTVEIEVAGGMQDTLFVPAAQFSESYVAGLATAKAADMVRVRALEGPRFTE
jgi:hypothetical protein